MDSSKDNSLKDSILSTIYKFNYTDYRKIESETVNAYGREFWDDIFWHYVRPLISTQEFDWLLSEMAKNTKITDSSR